MRLVEELPPLPQREADTHKGTYGRLLLVAGSEGMTGAPMLAARAAYRAGAGLVTVGIDRRLFAPISTAVPEAIFLDATSWCRERNLDGLGSYCAVLLGPGLGTEASRELVWAVLSRASQPLVLDADALNIIASEPGHSLARREDLVWTPHPGEFSRLTGEKPSGDKERVAAAEKFVRARGGVLVLKGHHTVVMDRERYAINQTGNPGMATAGAGDVLSGMIAAFLGQRLEPWAAARVAVHLHGRAGDLAAAELGEIPLVAGDLVQYLPAAIAEHLKETKTWKKG